MRRWWCDHPRPVLPICGHSEDGGRAMQETCTVVIKFKYLPPDGDIE